MRILSLHNYYLQAGGEDSVFRLEAELLRQHGHEVIEYLEDNRRIAGMSKISVALQTTWSWESYRRVKHVITQEAPDVAHFHNFFPLISPSAYYACREMGVPVVQNLDNQRLICPASTFYRDEQLCLDCLSKIPAWPGIRHACYHESRMHTAVVAAMAAFHTWRRTWQDVVNVYINSTNFYRQIYIKAGFPPEKLVVKPHFIMPPAVPAASEAEGDYALFIGRLEAVKGVRTLVAAWKQLDIPLKIRGSGDLEDETRAFIQAQNLTSVEIVERMDGEAFSELVGNACFLVLPSEGYYETFGMVIIEAYARGVPVLVAGIGVMPEMVRDGQTGLLFTPGDAHDLAKKAQWLWDNAQATSRLGAQALDFYRERFSPEKAYDSLMQIYRMAM